MLILTNVKQMTQSRKNRMGGPRSRTCKHRLGFGCVRGDPGRSVAQSNPLFLPAAATEDGCTAAPSKALDCAPCLGSGGTGLQAGDQVAHSHGAVGEAPQDGKGAGYAPRPGQPVYRQARRVEGQQDDGGSCDSDVVAAGMMVQQASCGLVDTRQQEACDGWSRQAQAGGSAADVREKLQLQAWERQSGCNGSHSNPGPWPALTCNQCRGELCTKLRKC